MYCDRNTGFTAFTTFRPATEEECQRHLAVISALRMNKDLHPTVFRLAQPVDFALRQAKVLRHRLIGPSPGEA